MASVTLEWDSNPAEDNVARYEIERRPVGQSLHASRFRRGAYRLLGRAFFAPWRRVGEVDGTQNRFEDSERFRGRLIVRPTYVHNTEILPHQSYEYRIRAVNNTGAVGPWAYHVVRALVGAGGLAQIQRLMNDVQVELNNARTQYTALRAIGDGILTINHNHLTAGGPPVGAGEWSNYARNMADITATTTRINNLIGQIIRDPAYPTLGPAERAAFYMLNNHYINILGTVRRYHHIFFIPRLRTGALP